MNKHLTPKEQALELLSIFFEDSEQDYRYVKLRAMQAVEFHTKQFEKWATDMGCAEDFSYKYWEEVIKEIQKHE